MAPISALPLKTSPCRSDPTDGIKCGLCMITSPSVLDHPLVEELLQREHVQHTSEQCGQCAERGREAVAVGACAECCTELCQECIEVSEMPQLCPSPQGAVGCCCEAESLSQAMSGWS